MIDHPDHSHSLHDVGLCEVCVTRLDRGIRDLGAEVSVPPGLWDGPLHTLPWHDRPMAHCPTCAPLLGLELGEPVPDAPGWYEGASVTEPLSTRDAHAGDPGRAQPCTCRWCRRVFDLRGPAASFGGVVDDLVADDEGLRVSGRIDPAAVAALYGVPPALLGPGGYAEPDWSDPDAGTCQAWHDRVPADSHCAICLWAPRDGPVPAPPAATDRCVCQPGMRHSCGIRAGTVAAATEAELAARGRWSRWLDRNGPNVLYWLGWFCFAAIVSTLRLGWWTPACWVAAAFTYVGVCHWARPQPNPVGMPGWEIRRGRTVRLPRLSIWRRPPLTVGLWWWRHSLDGGCWSPWWPARSHARAQQAVDRWLPFSILDALLSDLPPGVVPDVDSGHYRRSELATPGQLDAARRIMADQAQLLTVDQVRERAAGFLAQAGIPLAALDRVGPEDWSVEEAFEGVTIHGPATDPWDGPINTRVVEPGTQHPDHNWDNAQVMDVGVLDQPCYRCGAGRVLLSDLTGLCEDCKQELTG